MPSHVAVASVLGLCTAALAAAGIPIPATAGTGDVGPPLPPSGGGRSGECHRSCGGVDDIPYPFGVGPAENCSVSPDFHLDCNDTGNGVHKLFHYGVEVIDINLHQGQMRVWNPISYSCYNADNTTDMKEDKWGFTLQKMYSFNGASNKFTVVGCRTLAYISGAHGGDDDADEFQTGCVAMCGDGLNVTHLANGSCTGIGCCQTDIPLDLRYYDVSFDDRINASELFNRTKPCSYAVLMERSNFSFLPSYLTTNDFNKSNHGRVPVVLDWVAGNVPCTVARTKPGYACVSSNSECINAPSGLGYFCNCTKGYEGNPYLKDPYGCKDIDECKDRRTYPCYGDCNNKLGTYDCVCPIGTQGDAWIEPCHREPFLSLPLGARLAIGISAGVSVAVIAFLAIKVLLHKRSMKRQALFQHNGGQLLKQMLKVEGNDNFAVYSKRDILIATRNFHKTKIIGEGAHGTVYKATLRVGGSDTTVALKRCKAIDESRKKEFIQELVIVCHLSHPNIIKLVGCCLEFEAPMLVYEYAQNSNLNQMLHGRRPRRRVSLSTRLRIAAESAEALAHLHTHPVHPVLHGDVKPENILLADGFIAKVSDFGCSTIRDNVQVVPKGTLAYLDPEFLHDFRLTDKSDVYSFGVVLVELLTRKKPQSSSKEEKNLAWMFQEAIRQGTLHELLDKDIVVEESRMVVIQHVSELGNRCLAVPSTTRPPMEQVAHELRRLTEQVVEQHPQQLPQEVEDDLGLGPTEMEMTTGYPTAQTLSEGPGGTYGAENNAALAATTSENFGFSGITSNPAVNLEVAAKEVSTNISVMDKGCILDASDGIGAQTTQRRA
ncbi:hypothetical protein U9M48_040143 [Paspalum notatum var. saurae]|uniref:Protein kinase domain-containing protein n=1 Tax=Paspalum notatum var. saurae TaxID=547442 RepID=A0AAQ3UMS1_PASNO